MSTICKLDYNVRKARYARRDTISSLGRVIPSLQGMHAIAAMATHATLIEIKHSPQLTGAYKSYLFSEVLKQLEKSKHG